MDASHPLRVALGEVVVDRDDVNALARKRVEVGREGGDEGLTLAGLHLRDVAQVQGGTAHDLHVVVALAQRALGSLAHGGKGLRQQVVERLAVGQPLLERVGLFPQLGVGQRDEVFLDDVDLLRDAGEALEDLALARTHELVEESRHAWTPSSRRQGVD